MAGNLSAFEIFQFSLAPKYGLEWGQMNELVLYKNGNKESELNWEIDSLNLLGFNATAGWEKILIEADCMWGIPKASGIMKDSDWLNTSDYGMKTDYSESSNAVDFYGDMELRLALNIKTWEFLHILPYGAIAYSRIKYTATGGTAWYGHSFNPMVSWDDSSVTALDLDSYGDVISYERESYSYKIGLKVKYSFLSRFTLAADFGFDIYTLVNSFDSHLVTKYDYFDKMQGFFKSFDLGAELDVKIWKGLSAGASFKYVFINQMVGNDYKKSSDSSSYTLLSSVNAAASGYYYHADFFVRYSF